MDTGLSHRRPRFILGHGVIAKSRVSALPIIEHFDILEDVLRRFGPRAVVPMVHKLTLERPEEAFDAGVVPAIALSAHAWRDAVSGEQLLVARSEILAAAIGVVQQPRSKWPVRARHEKDLPGQLPGQSLAHRQKARLGEQSNIT